MPKRAPVPKSRTLMYTQQLSHMPFGDVDSLYAGIEGKLGRSAMRASSTTMT